MRYEDSEFTGLILCINALQATWPSFQGVVGWLILSFSSLSPISLLHDSPHSMKASLDTCNSIDEISAFWKALFG